MVTETPKDNGTGTTGSTGCPSVESQLEEINQKIIEFEAQKFAELKSELEQVKKKKEDSVKEYKAKFDGLKKQWCEQNDHIISMRRDIIGAFPDWKAYISECVCSQLAKKRVQENRIACRTEVKGRFEKARDDAKAKLDAAKQTASGWENAIKVLTEQLAQNSKLIDELCKLTCTPDRTVAIYRLWFKLLPAHARIRPVTDCFTVPPTETCEQLCPPNKPPDSCRDCDAYEPAPPTTGDCAAKPADDKPESEETPPEPKWPQGDPWLVPPEEYAGKIDCAYDAYLKAKRVYGTAVRCFQTYADDLPQVKKDLDALIKGLDAAIEDCLKKKKDKGCCDDEDDKKPDPCKPSGDGGTQQSRKGA